MKKLSLIVITGMLLYSCSNEEDLKNNKIPTQEIEVVEVSNNVTLDDIQTYMEKGSAITSRNGGNGEIEVITYQNDTVMYLLNYGNGWEMMPGDKRFPLRVAYNNEGVLDYDNMHDAQRAWFENMAEEIHFMKRNGGNYENKHSEIWKRLKGKNKPSQESRTIIDGQDGWIYHNTRVNTFIRVEKDHILNTIWHKNTPYNEFSPFEPSSNTIHCSTGSSAVAIGQVLNYLRTHIGTPTHTVVSQVYDEINRKYVFSGWSTAPWSRIEQGDSTDVARLLGHVGVLCNMKYISWDNSYCNFQTDILRAFNEYGITATLENSWDTDLIVTNLNNNLPLLAEIRSSLIKEETNPNEEEEPDDDDGSHTMTIDGYRIIDTQYTDVYIHVEDPDSYPGDIYDHDSSGEPVPEEGPTRETSYTVTDVYVLYNWGYGNEDNTAYLSNSNIIYNGASFRFTDRMWHSFRKL